MEEEKKKVFDNLKQFIAEIIGEDIATELDITESSSFTKDLEMDSIEIVAFAEKVKKRYGSEIDFTGWLSTMDLDQLINLCLGDITNFIINADHSTK